MKKIVLSFFALVMAFTLRAQVTLTLQVDMTNFINAGGTVADTVHVAGTFGTNGCLTIASDWSPPLAPNFTNIGNNIYSADVVFPDSSIGDTLLFKFLNSNTWGACDLQQECSVPLTCSVDPANHNRVLPIPPVNSTFTALFDSCGTLTVTGIKNITNFDVNSLYPNPASGKANLVYTTKTIGKVQISISNLVGQVVKTVFSGTQALGVHTQAIDVSGLANGVYFLTLKVNDQSVARKFNVMN